MGELWSLFDFLMPGFLESETVFKRLYRNPIEKEGVTEIAKALFERISPFILRRTKNEVATELPPKTEVVVKIPLTDKQQDLYETLRLASNPRRSLSSRYPDTLSYLPYCIILLQKHKFNVCIYNIMNHYGKTNKSRKNSLRYK